MRQINLAIDVMGGDLGPMMTINGVYQASKLYPNVHFRLFGNCEEANHELEKYNDFKNYELIHTLEFIKSDDEPVNALRKLKKSSLRLAVNDVGDGMSHGLVSAGNTDFTAVGAGNNNVGTSFTATGVGSGTGTANQTDHSIREYIPMPIIIDGLELQADGAQNRPSFTVANLGTLLTDRLAGFKNDDLIGQRIKRRQTLKKYLVGESADASPPIEYRTQEYVIDRIAKEDNISIIYEVAAPYDLENIKLPRRVVVGKFCSWKYQGYHNATNSVGGCTWKLDGSINYKTDSGTFSHNAYFDINDSPLVPSGETYAAYSSSTAYTTVDYVTHDTKFWVCIVAGTGNTPSSTSAFWKEVFKSY